MKNWRQTLRNFLPGALAKSSGNFFNHLFGPQLAAGTASLTKPMKQSVWVMAAIKTVADPIAGAPLVFQTSKGANRVPYVNPVLAAFWENPSPGMTQEAFFETSLTWLLLKGEFFWILDDTWLVGGGKAKSRPFIARPEDMKEVVVSGHLIGWTYIDAGGRRVDLIPENVVHYKLPNPYDRWRGLAPMEAAFVAADADYSQGVFASNLAKNNGDRGAYIVAKGPMPTEEQQKQIQRALTMKQEAARKGQLRAMFLTGDIDVKDPAVQAPDANFVSQRIENRHEVATAFGVPMSFFDVAASYSIGSASDLFRLLSLTCMPLARRVSGPVETVSRRLLDLAPSIPLYAERDFSGHPAMQQARLERIDSVTKLFNVGVPMKQASEFVGLGLPEYPGWEQGYVPMSMIPVGEGTSPSDSAAESADPAPEIDPAEKIRRAFAGRLRCVRAGNEAGSKAREIWDRHMAMTRGHEKAFKNAIGKALYAARSEVLEKLAALDKGMASGESRHIEIRAGAAAALLFDKHSFAAKFLAGTEAVSRDAYDAGGKLVFQDLGKADAWTAPPTEVKRFLEQRKNLLRDVPNEIHATVERSLSEGIEKGEAIPDLMGRVRDTFNGIKAGRALTIAITETMSAFAASGQVAMEQAGVPYKQWITAGDERVRDSHQEAHGQVVGVQDSFRVGGEAMDHPCDPNASPDQTVNCRCISVACPTPEGIA